MFVRNTVLSGRGRRVLASSSRKDVGVDRPELDCTLLYVFRVLRFIIAPIVKSVAITARVSSFLSRGIGGSRSWVCYTDRQAR